MNSLILYMFWIRTKKIKKFIITFSLWTLQCTTEYIRYRSHKYTLALHDKLGLFALPSEGSPQKKACPRSFSNFECLKRSKLAKNIRLGYISYLFKKFHWDRLRYCISVPRRYVLIMTINSQMNIYSVFLNFT